MAKIRKSNRAAFTDRAEAEARAEQLNRGKFRRSRIGVKVIRMNPYWVIVGCPKAEVRHTVYNRAGRAVQVTIPQ